MAASSRALAVALAALAVLSAARAPGAVDTPVSREADAFHAKLLRIAARGERRPVARAALAPQTTTITERELNAYLRYRARDQIPVGITDPYIWIVGDGRLAGRATIDLDAVRRQKMRGWLDPAGYLTGRLPLQVSGRLHTRDGVGRFRLESAEIGGVSVPRPLLQELLAYYSRTPDDPDGVSLDEPFALPAGIREIRVEKGRATIVQ
ncbi:MAG TPA: hypothetical protein VNK92_05560 [Vicinamibacterales bacterium]|jgi:hypothetical protein|nr:hypothetical protein [Vicinamibacterales bacterium]